MTLKEFVQLLRRHWLLLVTLPVATAISIFFFTRKEAKEFASDTTIYTGIASTYNIDKNNAGSDYSNSKAYSTLLSLINSRATKQEVALRLLAKHLSLRSYDSTVLSPETYSRLHLLINEPLQQQLVGTSLEETTRNLTTYLGSNNQNVLYRILNSNAPNYSFAALDKISASQVGNSDLVKIEYVADDAVVCQQTLVELTNVFTRRHKQLQEGQNGSVVGYFGEAAAKARRRLDSAEKKLLSFQQANNLIDYDEQSESVATQRDGLEQQANDLEMQYAGALSAYRALQKTVKGNGVTDISSQKTYFLSNQLVKLRTQTANAEVFNRGKTDAASTAAIRKLKEQTEQVERQLQASINGQSDQDSDTQPTGTKGLANDLIRSGLLVEELRAKLLVLRKQQNSFGKEYQKVAPLGMEKRQIEREREVAEKEYLAVTNNLDQSQVAQQNIELTSRLKIVDPPYLALNRAKSKRLLLLLFGSLGTLLLAVGSITASALLDQSLQNPEVAKAKTRLPVFGILPDAGGSPATHTPLFSQAQAQLARLLLLRMQPQLVAQKPYIVGIVSSHQAEGKSTIVASFSAQLEKMGIKTLNLLPTTHKEEGILSGATAFYTPLHAISPQITLADLASVDLSQYQVVLVEFPALLEAVYPVAVLPHLDIMLVTADANRTWQPVDKDLFDAIRISTKAPIELIINKLLADFAKNYLGPRAEPTTQGQSASSASRLPQWHPQTALQA
jgi:uncharacterized protein involved in exopolysaccharide biosynthesis